MKSDTYTEFLERYLEGSESLNIKKIAQAELARRCDFSSRSLPRELILGKRALSHANLLKLEKGMKLPIDMRDLFRLLVSKKELKLNLADGTNSEKDKKIKKIRKQIEKKYGANILKNESSSLKDIMGLRYPLQIYASLNVQAHGSTLEDIYNLTNIPKSVLKKDLKIMEKLKLVKYSEDHDSYSCDENLLFIRSHLSDVLFRNIFQRSFRRILAFLNQDYDKKDSSIYSNVLNFRAKRSDLPLIKNKLHESLSSIMSEFDNDEGEEVLSISLFSCPEKYFHKK